MATQPIQVPDLVYLTFTADINPPTVDVFIKACTELSGRGVKTLYILFSTMGGQVAQGIALYHVLRALPAKKVMHNVGAVNSIGNVVFLAGDERYASPDATFMFHGVGIDAQNVRLEERLLVEKLGQIRADQKKIGAIIKSRTRFPRERDIARLFLRAATKDAKFAKEVGIINDVREVQIPAGAPVVPLVFQR